MMKKILLFTSCVVLFSGCDQINEVKLNYELQDCLARSTVSCTDSRIKQAILKAKKFRQEFIDDKQGATAEFGEERYQKLLALTDQKIKHLEEQRPNFFYRWFKGEETYYGDIDFGDAIDTQILQILHENEKQAKPQNLSTSQDDSNTQQIQNGGMIETAPVENNELSPPPKHQFQFPYSFQITAPTLEQDYDKIIHTNQGAVYFSMNSTSVWQNGILDNLKVGDCIYFTADYAPIKKGNGAPYFDMLISDPENVSCDSIQ